MQKNDLFRCENDIFRVLDSKQDGVFIINCTRQTMPQWCDFASFSDYKVCTEQDLLLQSGLVLSDIDMLSPSIKRVIHERYTIVAGVLPFLCDSKLRNAAISRIAENKGICKQKFLPVYACCFQGVDNFASESEILAGNGNESIYACILPIKILLCWLQNPIYQKSRCLRTRRTCVGHSISSFIIRKRTA